MSFSVRLNPLNRVWRGEERVDLATAAADCDIVLDLPCGGRTACGKCRVRVTTGAAPATEREVETLGAGAVADGWRLGCRLELHANAVVELPNALQSMPLKSFGPQIVFPDGFTPALRLPDTRDVWGFAVDVGTTTLAVALVHLRTGEVAGTISQVNPQASYGADVMTRIGFARETAHGNRELHVRLIAALNVMFREVLSAAAIPRSAVCGVVFVGNATMMHTLVGADVSLLGEAPYQGLLRGAWRGVPADIGIDLPPHVQIYCAPIIRSHIGGDTVGNIVANHMGEAPGISLLIDLGTNTEMVLAVHERLLATTASGGPAFEGGSIQQGMRAIPGAIDQLRISATGRLQTHTVARARPIGICGSGVLDAVAEMLRTGVVEFSGRMRACEEIDESLQGPLGRRLVSAGAHGRGLWVGGPADDPIIVTAEDVRQLQLVKGSIAAATAMLLEHAGIELSDVQEFLVAGAFGNFIRKTSAQIIGLLPDIDPELVHFVGHAAGVGARMLLLDAETRNRAAYIATHTEFVDLAGRPDYEERFVEALPFPVPLAAIA